MKTTHIFSWVLRWVAVGFLGTTACTQEEVPLALETRTLLQALDADPSHQLFLEGLRLTQLDLLLEQADASFTLFPPDNTSMETYLAEENAADLQAVDPQRLEAILRYHVVKGRFAIQDFIDQPRLPTLLDTLTLRVENTPTWRINGVPFSPEQVREAADGLLYPMQTVFTLPPTAQLPSASDVWQYLRTAPQYTAFYELLQRGGWESELAGRDSLTFFVFDNTTANLFLRAKGFDSAADVPRYFARYWIAYHLLDTRYETLADLAAARTLYPLSDKPLHVIREGLSVALQSPLAPRELPRLAVLPTTSWTNGLIYTLEEPLDAPITLKNMVEEEEEFRWLKTVWGTTPQWEYLDDWQTTHTLVALTRAQVEHYASKQIPASASLDDFLETPAALSLANLHLLEGQLSDNSEDARVLRSASELPNIPLRRSVLWLPNQTLNGTTSLQRSNYPVSNGTCYFADAPIGILRVQDILPLHPATQKAWQVVVQNNFQNLLSGGANGFTFLAPDNAAFEALIANPNEYDSLAQVRTNTLLYHWISGYQVETALRTGQILPTGLLNQSLTVSVSEGTVFLGGRSTARARANAFIAENGVLYILDHVLLP